MRYACQHICICLHARLYNSPFSACISPILYHESRILNPSVHLSASSLPSTPTRDFTPPCKHFSHRFVRPMFPSLKTAILERPGARHSYIRTSPVYFPTIFTPYSPKKSLHAPPPGHWGHWLLDPRHGTRP